MLIKNEIGTFYIPDESSSSKSSLSNLSIKERLENGTWEREEIDMLREYLDINDSVLELGGCIGFLGVYANRILSNPTRHTIIEANPELIEVILKNIDLNNSKFNVLNCIIGNPNEIEQDFVISDFILGSFIYATQGKKVKVPIRSLADFTEEYNFIIIDIEGGEYELINNNLQHLSKFNKIIIEFHPFFGFTKNDINNSLKKLEQIGFKKIKNIGHTYYLKKNIKNEN